MKQILWLKPSSTFSKIKKMPMLTNYTSDLIKSESTWTTCRTVSKCSKTSLWNRLVSRISSVSCNISYSSEMTLMFGRLFENHCLWDIVAYFILGQHILRLSRRLFRKSFSTNPVSIQILKRITSISICNRY